MVCAAYHDTRWTPWAQAPCCTCTQTAVVRYALPGSVPPVIVDLRTDEDVRNMCEAWIEHVCAIAGDTSHAALHQPQAALKLQLYLEGHSQTTTDIISSTLTSGCGTAAAAGVPWAQAALQQLSPCASHLQTSGRGLLPQMCTQNVSAPPSPRAFPAVSGCVNGVGRGGCSHVGATTPTTTLTWTGVERTAPAVAGTDQDPPQRSAPAVLPFVRVAHVLEVLKPDDLQVCEHVSITPFLVRFAVQWV
jgi:hypothetical protein